MTAGAGELTHAVPPAPGMRAVPGGHLQPVQIETQATVRKAGEELDVEADPADLLGTGFADVPTAHGTTSPIIFAAQRRRGAPRRAEPRKYLETAGHHADEGLSEPNTPHRRAMVRRIVGQAASRPADTVADVMLLPGWQEAHR